MPLQLDTTGLASANRINGEQLAVTPQSLATFGCLYLSNGPFFGKNFAISYTPAFPAGSAAVPLVLGVDYDFKFELPGFGDTVQDKVWGAINIYNQGFNGAITVSYQALGGSWVINQQKIRTYLNTNQFNSSFQYMALVNDGPLYLPNNPTAIWPLNSIQSITIAQAQLSSITLTVQFLRNDGNDEAPASNVVVLDLPLPPNAAKENGGNLAIVAAAQGTSGAGINQPTGGSGILGWLSGVFAQLVLLLAAANTIITRFASAFSVAQSGSWSVGLLAGNKTIGDSYDTAFSEIVDYTTTAGYVYICQAQPGSDTAQALWRIQRITLATGRVLWASGLGTFTNIADNRASLTYS